MPGRRRLVPLAAIAIAGIAAFTLSVPDAAPVAAAPRAAHPGARMGALGGCPWLNPLLPVRYRVNKLIAAMSLEQEASMMVLEAGAPYNGYQHYVTGIPSLCVPAVMQQDSAAGVAAGVTGVTQLPAPIAAASTFDHDVMKEYGAIIGREMRGKGIGFALAPTLNLVRVPQWGRAFESLGEDPYLTAHLGDADIEGIQGQGVIADVKHYAEYNQEANRNPSLSQDDVSASQRTMEETELAVFGSAVRDAGAGSVMCAMVSVNGTGACQNTWLLSVLTGQYGFQGDVRSDNPESATVESAAVNAGLDQAAPPLFSVDGLVGDVSSGVISKATLDAAVGHIVYPMFQMGLFNNPPTGGLGDNVSSPGDRSFARSAAEDGTVLLKNNGILPLAGRSSIAVIGSDAGSDAVTSGGGSAHVYSGDVVTPRSGISARAGSRTRVTYTMGSGPYDTLPDIPSADLSPVQGGGNGLTADIYNNTSWSGSPASSGTVPTVDMEVEERPAAYGTGSWSARWSGTLRVPSTGTYQFSLTGNRACQLYIGGQLVVDDGAAWEGVTRHTVYGSAFLLGGQQVQIQMTYKHTAGSAQQNAGVIAQLGWLPPGGTPPSIAAAVAAAKSASVAIVFAGSFESEDFDQPNLSLPGIDDQLISAVAAANPNTIVVLNTGGPVLMPWLDKVAGVVEAWYPGQEDGTAIASVLWGDVNPGGKLPVTFPADARQPLTSDSSRYPGFAGTVSYSEGLDIGYKWYQSRGERPLFPFGFGLSYTSFSFSGLRVSRLNVRPSPGGDPGRSVAVVQATVTNTGSRSGSEVAQLYLSSPAPGEPSLQLRGFQRVTLSPGQSTQLTFTLSAQDLAYWAGSGWQVAGGTYVVHVGDSSAALPLSGSFSEP
jgi:beta-glucosidase